MKMINNKKYEFNFDSCSLNGLYLGSFIQKHEVKIPLQSYDNGYVIYTENNLITGIFLCINEGYRDSKIFNGLYKKSSESINFAKTTTPSDVISYFGKPLNCWNDGVGETYIYKNRKCEYEFFWDVRSKEVTLEYLIIDLSFKMKQRLLEAINI